MLPEKPTWQRPYLTDHRLSTDVLETTAEVAEKLGMPHMPHMSPEAARHCRDKLGVFVVLELFGASGLR